MMKLPEQFKALFADNRALDETLGHDLAQWARGAKPADSAAASADEIALVRDADRPPPRTS